MIQVELKSGRKRVTSLSLTGEPCQKAPASYVNYFNYARGYAEIPPTPYAFFQLETWAEKNEQQLQVHPSVTRYLDSERERRRQFLNTAGFSKIKPDITGLYEHQIAGVKFAIANAQYNNGAVRMLLADDPRLGKSAQALSIIRQVEDNGIILLLCPKALLHQWKVYVETWLPESDTVILTGESKKRKEQLEKFEIDKNKFSVIIANWETLHMTGVFELIKKLPVKALIGDEAHKLKNRESRIVGKVAELDVKHMILLSATFTENWPSDYWSPLHLIEPYRFSSYWRFVGHYIESKSDTYGGIEFKETKDANVLKDHLSLYVLQRRSDEVVAMPEKIYETFFAEMSKEHRKFYQKVEDQVRVELTEGSLSMPNRVSKIMRLRQAALHQALLDPAYEVNAETLDTGKLAMLKHLMENFIPEDEQVIVYSSFIDGAKLGFLTCSEWPGFVYAGSEGTETDIEKFHNKEFKIMFATPQRGGVGLNLYNANYLIFLDKPWSTIALRQAEERVRAMNKQGPVYIIDVLAEDSIDAYVNALVTDKLKNVSETEIINSLVENLLK